MHCLWFLEMSSLNQQHIWFARSIVLILGICQAGIVWQQMKRWDPLPLSSRKRTVTWWICVLTYPGTAFLQLKIYHLQVTSEQFPDFILFVFIAQLIVVLSIVVPHRLRSGHLGRQHR
jgi:hypothetical protein